MRPVIKKNLILYTSAFIGFSIATVAQFPTDPVRPHILIVGVLIVVNINLQYLLGLTMGITYPLATPYELGKRNRILVVSWLLLALMIFGFIAW